MIRSYVQQKLREKKNYSQNPWLQVSLTNKGVQAVPTYMIGPVVLV
jgi:hypothetical protein